MKEVLNFVNIVNERILKRLFTHVLPKVVDSVDPGPLPCAHSLNEYTIFKSIILSNYKETKISSSRNSIDAQTI